MKNVNNLRTFFKAISILLFSILFCYLYGIIYRKTYDFGSQTVRIAACQGTTKYIDNFNSTFTKNRLSTLEEAVSTLSEVSHRASNAGAKILLWSEYAFQLAQNDKADFLREASKVAAELKVYMLIALKVVSPDRKTKKLNIAAWINDQGELEHEYIKRNLVPILERNYQKGDGNFLVSSTKYGKIGAVICYDMTIPLYMNKVGRKNLDILLVPSYDYKGIYNSHYKNDLLQSVSMGTNMVRNAGHGIILGVDAVGNVLLKADSALMDVYSNAVIVDLPIKGRGTLIGIIGEWLQYPAMLIIMISAIQFFRSSQRNKSHSKSQ